MANLDMADVKPTLLSWFIVGMMAVSFIAFAKFAMTRWPIPGFSEMVHSV